MLILHNSELRRGLCFLHIGTHKTGTTAIQRFLARNAKQLAAAGLLVPQSGRTGPDTGHHELAAALRSRPASEVPTVLSDVLAELRATRPYRACLSAEDFECLDNRPDVLAAVRTALDGIGYDTRIILYVRDQAQYAESLFAELVSHGYSESFDRWIDRILSHRFVDYEMWRFHFEYSTLVRRFARVFCASAIDVRGYRAPISLIDDFLLALGFASRRSADVGEESTFENRRRTTNNVVRRWVCNVAQSSPVDDASDWLATIARDELAVDVPFAPMRAIDRGRFRERFARDNGVLVRDWNVAPATFAPSGEVENDDDAARARALLARAEVVCKPSKRFRLLR